MTIKLWFPLFSPLHFQQKIFLSYKYSKEENDFWLENYLADFIDCLIAQTTIKCKPYQSTTFGEDHETGGKKKVMFIDNSEVLKFTN